MGLNTAKAVGLNVFAAMVSFVGVFIGLALATRTAAADWILCLVTGLFIYIPLVHVVSEFESYCMYTLVPMHHNRYLSVHQPLLACQPLSVHEVLNYFN